jgi:hypothetical protein
MGTQLMIWSFGFQMHYGPHFEIIVFEFFNVKPISKIFVLAILKPKPNSSSLCLCFYS